MLNSTSIAYFTCVLYILHCLYFQQSIYSSKLGMNDMTFPVLGHEFDMPQFTVSKLAT
jgi:hypothetical protein